MSDNPPPFASEHVPQPPVPPVAPPPAPAPPPPLPAMPVPPQQPVGSIPAPYPPLVSTSMAYANPYYDRARPGIVTAVGTLSIVFGAIGAFYNLVSGFSSLGFLVM